MSTVTGNALQCTSNAQITQNAWHIITVTYDGSSTAAGIKIYDNGVLQASTPNTVGVYVAMAPKTTNLGLGSWSLGTTPFNGAIGLEAVTGTDLTANNVWNATQAIKSIYQIP
jgi:hypothetical protein